MVLTIKTLSGVRELEKAFLSPLLLKVPGIYYIQNWHSGKLYVGSSVNVRHRVTCHFSNLARGEHRNSYLQAGYDRDGAGAFVSGPLEYCDSKLLHLRESEWFGILLPFGNSGYNIAHDTDCPTRGLAKSAEHRARIGAAHKGKPRVFTAEHLANLRAACRTEEYREKQRVVQTGRPGHPLSAEQRAKLLASHVGIPMSGATRKKLSAAIKGRKLPPRSPEWCGNISKGKRGKARGPHSPETIAKLRARLITPEWRERLRVAALKREARFREVRANAAIIPVQSNEATT